VYHCAATRNFYGRTVITARHTAADRPADMAYFVGPDHPPSEAADSAFDRSKFNFDGLFLIYDGHFARFAAERWSLTYLLSRVG
jgi:hypothetical protein